MTTEVLNSMENVKCNEVAGTINAFFLGGSSIGGMKLSLFMDFINVLSGIHVSLHHVDPTSTLHRPPYICICSSSFLLFFFTTTTFILFSSSTAITTFLLPPPPILLFYFLLLLLLLLIFFFTNRSLRRSDRLFER